MLDYETLERQVIVPDSEEHWLALRRLDLTSTDVAALFGMSERRTLLDLWHSKRDGLDLFEHEDNERQEWGRYLEPGIAAWRANEEGVEIRRMHEYIRLPQLRIASSFDYGVLADQSDPSPFTPVRKIYECKNVGYLIFRDQWIETSEGYNAPDWIEIQVQHEMGVSGIHEAEIIACVGGNEGIVLPRRFEPDVFRGIMAAADEFWDSIAKNKPPRPDFSRDLPVLKKIHGYAEPGKILETDNSRILELMQAANRASREEARAKLDKETAQAELLTLIGNAERVHAGGWKLFAGTTGPVTVPSFERKGFRQLRITPPKSA